jgi:hypothetical protein
VREREVKGKIAWDCNERSLDGFDGYIHGFENLKKNKMFNSSRDHNRRIAKSDRKIIIYYFMSYNQEL